MYTNRLVHETSPYLRQHAHNPVDWYPWGEEAFARAREEDKPIFLSIGYAACHWCHVMERESFDDAQLAATLNTHFVPIKVDREERPDVDGIYIQALMTINGEAGWPASLFLKPDLRPFAGATYLPPRPMHGLPSFRQVLERVRDSWKNHREAIDRAADQLHFNLASAPDVAGPRQTEQGYHDAISALLRIHDDEEGGFGHGQKFPQTPELELLLLGAVDELPGAHAALRKTLRAIDDGGLQDHVGGGFHRYCVDREWSVPHFEKMLYDNAQLARLFARSSALWAARGLRDEAIADIRVVRDTIAYLLRDLRDPTGAFRSSEDADDEHGEGAFYSWNEHEARDALGPDWAGPLPYGIGTPNFEHGRTVPHAHGGRPPRPVRERLLEARAQRPRPPVDDKLVVAWNGLAIGALAEAGRLFGNEDWVAAAVRCAEVVLGTRDEDGVLPRLVPRGPEGTRIPGTLEDQAFVADGLLDLHQARPSERRWLDEALSIARTTIERFGDPERGGFFQSRPRADLVVRRKELQDGAEPSGYGRMANVLARLVALGALDADVRDRVLGAAGGFMANNAIASPELWRVVRSVAARPWELKIAGDPNHPTVRQMLLVWNRTWRPQGVVQIVPPEAPDRVVAYPCRMGVCQMPVETPEELRTVLDG